MRKSAVACTFTAEHIIEAGGSTWWTFTFDPGFKAGDVGLNHDWGADQWDRCLRALRREYSNLGGIRVFEPHKDGRLHIHVIFNRRLPIQHVRRLSRRYGFGRINCKQVVTNESTGLAHYLTKYLRKTHADRHEHFRKGRRLWASFGKLPNKSLVKNIRCDSPSSRFLKWWFRAPLQVAEDFFCRTIPWSFSTTEGQILPRQSLPKLKTHGQRWRWSDRIYVAFSIWWGIQGKNSHAFPGLQKAMSTPAWDM